MLDIPAGVVGPLSGKVSDHSRIVGHNEVGYLDQFLNQRVVAIFAASQPEAKFSKALLRRVHGIAHGQAYILFHPHDIDAQRMAVFVAIVPPPLTNADRKAQKDVFAGIVDQRVVDRIRPVSPADEPAHARHAGGAATALQPRRGVGEFQ